MTSAPTASDRFRDRQQPLSLSGGNGSLYPRVCENPQEPISWRIVFSIALFPIPANALSLLRLAKSRRIFYAQIECLCFHTGWPHCRRSTSEERVSAYWVKPSDQAGAPFSDADPEE